MTGRLQAAIVGSGNIDRLPAEVFRLRGQLVHDDARRGGRRELPAPPAPATCTSSSPRPPRRRD